MGGLNYTSEDHMFFSCCSRVGVGKRLFEDGLIIEELITKKGLMGLRKNAIVNGKLVEN
jgi:hypothetical protein